MKHLKLISVLIFFLSFFIIENSCAQNIWVQKTNFGGAVGRRESVGFSIGEKGYIGTGYDESTSTTKKDFWEWDQASNIWIQKADFGGSARNRAVGFSIGTKGYIGTGASSSGRVKDFWEWDQGSNSWSQKTDFGGTAREGSVGFSIGNKGYIGTGFDGSYKKDFWEWDQGSNVWSQKADFGGPERFLAVGFSTENKGYIGTGTDYISNKKDFWEWDQSSNVWSQKADFGGGLRYFAVGFSICNKGFIGTGSNTFYTFKDFWEWDPTSNSWNQQLDIGSTTRYGSTGFAIGNKGYIGTGSGLRDFWEYSTFTTNTISPASFCAGASVSVPFTIEVCAINAGNVFTAQLSDASGSFASPINIGTLTGTTSGTINATIPINTVTGTGYRIRVVSSSPYDVSCDNGVNITITKIWTQKANLTTGRYTAVGFSIGTKAYIGTGYSPGGIYLKDFWEWNQTTNVWTQKADLGGVARQSAVGFAIGTKGYIGTGVDVNGNNKNDFWEWNQTNNTWTARASFGGTARFGATGFSISNKGYIGTGYDGTVKNDFWEFDPSIGTNGTWTQKSNFGGNARDYATGFAILGKGYIATGYNASTTYFSDFWEYDPSGDTWSSKTPFPGPVRWGGSSFSIGDKGYIGTGFNPTSRYLDDLYEWNQTNNSWSQKSNFSTKRYGAVGFSIGNNGYFTTGFNEVIANNDLWEFNTCDLAAITTNTISPSLYCIGSSISIAYTAIGIYNGANIFTAQLSDASGNFDSPVNIGTLTSTTSGTISATIPSNAAAGANYRVRVIASNPYAIGSDNGSNISISTDCGSYMFNGIDSRIQAPYGGLYGIYDFGVGDFTLETWVKMDPSSTGNRPIISKRSSSSFTGAFRFRVESGTQLSLDINGTNTLSNVFTNINDGNCHHVAVTRSGSTISFYLDGTIQGTGANGQNISSSNLLSLGYDPYDNISLKGNLDEVRIWNLARTQAQISTSKSIVIAGNTNGLVSYYQMNEISGQTVTDGGSGYNPGWLGSDPLSSDAQDPVRSTISCYTPVLESSLTFDGVNDRVRILHHTAYNIGSGDFTLEAWIKLQSNSNGAIISKRNLATDGFLFTSTASGTQLSLQLSGTTYLSGTFTNILDNACHHVAVKRSGSTLTFYVDGVIKGTATSTLGMNSTGFLHVGYDKINNASLSGNINEIRFWNAARTDAQISSGQASVLPDNTTNLIGYFKFNEPSDQPVIDASSTANNGYLGTGSSFDSADPIRVATSCFSGDRMAFDDIEDIGAFNEFQVHIYPNPFNQGINILMNDQEEVEGDISVLDMNGKILWVDYIRANEIKTLDLLLPGGIYIFQLNRNGKVETYKIVKLD